MREARRIVIYHRENKCNVHSRNLFSKLATACVHQDAQWRYGVTLYRGQSMGPAEETDFLLSFPHNEDAIAEQCFCNGFFPERVPGHPMLAVSILTRCIAPISWALSSARCNLQLVLPGLEAFCRKLERLRPHVRFYIKYISCQHIW